jgi:hypothetical protein
MSDVANEPLFASVLTPDAVTEAFYLNEPTSDGWGGDNGGPAVVTSFERDVQSLFDPNQVVWSDDNAANLSNGWTFLDRDGDGWYDHIETTNDRGIWIYCGDGIWNPM